MPLLDTPWPGMRNTPSKKRQVKSLCLTETWDIPTASKLPGIRVGTASLPAMAPILGSWESLMSFIDSKQYIENLIEHVSSTKCILCIPRSTCLSIQEHGKFNDQNWKCLPCFISQIFSNLFSGWCLAHKTSNEFLQHTWSMEFQTRASWRPNCALRHQFCKTTQKPSDWRILRDFVSRNYLQEVSAITFTFDLGRHTRISLDELWSRENSLQKLCTSRGSTSVILSTLQTLPVSIQIVTSSVTKM